MFRGSIVALVTPLEDDKVDLKKLRDLVEFHIAEGTHAIVAAGTTGESGTLSHEEKSLVIKTVVEQTKERIPVIGAIAANATKDCIELTGAAMELGVHAALIMTPAYIRPTQEGLYQHYSQIAAAVPIPLIVYNVPTRTACDILPETLARLAHISNIIGVKEATGTMARLQQILRLTDHSIDVFSGDDETAASWMLAGAKGVISVTANVVPKRMAKMCDAAIDGDNSTCLQINEQIMPLHKLLFSETNPIPAKWALAKMGLIKDELRLPLTSLSEAYHYPLEHILRELELIM
jgi:4-hydroxy-tetrahydrodipicolinate synthase